VSTTLSIRAIRAARRHHHVFDDVDLDDYDDTAE